jgi:hypothetical protein
MFGGADALTVHLLLDTSQSDQATARTNKNLETMGKMAAQAGRNGAAGMDQLNRSMTQGAQMSLNFGGAHSRAAQMVQQAWQRTTQVVAAGWQAARNAVENAGAGIVSMLKRIQDAHKNVDDSTREFAAHMREFVENPMRGMGTLVENIILSTGKMGAVFLAAAAGIAIAAKATFDFLKGQAEAAHQFELLSVRTGLSIKESQQYSAAAKIEGVDINSLTMMIRALSQSLSENSDEGKKGKRALDELKVSAYQSNGQMKDTGALLHDIGAALSKIPEGAERTRLSIAMFGRAGVELLPLIGNMKEVDRIFKEFGLPDETIRQLSQGNKDITELSLKWEQMKMQVAGALVAKIKVLAEWDESIHKSGLGKVLETMLALPGKPVLLGKVLLAAALGPPGAATAVLGQQIGSEGTPQTKTPAEIAADAARDADIRAGDAIRLAAKRQRDATMAGIEEQLTGAKEELGKARGAAEQPRLGAEAAKQSQASFAQAQAAVDLLERRKALLTAMPEAHKKATEEAMHMQDAELTGLKKLNAEYARYLDTFKVRTPGGMVSTLTPADKALLDHAHGMEQGALMAKEYSETLKKNNQQRMFLGGEKGDAGNGALWTVGPSQAERQKDIEKSVDEQIASQERDAKERNRAYVEIPKQTDAIQRQTQEARLDYVKKEAAQERDAQMEELQEVSKRALSIHGLTMQQKLAITKKSSADELAIETEYRQKVAKVETDAIERRSREEIGALTRQEALALPEVKAALEEQIKAIKDRAVESTHELMQTLNAQTELSTQQSLDRQAAMIEQQYDQVYSKVKGILGQIWDEAQRKGVGIGKAIEDTLRKTVMGEVKDKVTGTMADMIAPIFGGKKQDPSVTLAGATDKNSDATKLNTTAVEHLTGELGSLRMGGGAAPASGDGSRNYGSMLPGFFGSKAPAGAMAAMSLIAPFMATGAPRARGDMSSPAAIERALGPTGGTAAQYTQLPSGLIDRSGGSQVDLSDVFTGNAVNPVLSGGGYDTDPGYGGAGIASSGGGPDLRRYRVSPPDQFTGGGGGDAGPPPIIQAAQNTQVPAGLAAIGSGTTPAYPGGGGGFNPGMDISDPGNPYSLDSGSSSAGAAGGASGINQAKGGGGSGPGLSSPQGVAGMLQSAQKMLGGFGGSGAGGGGMGSMLGGMKNFAGFGGLEQDANGDSWKSISNLAGNRSVDVSTPGGALTALGSSQMAGTAGMMLMMNGLGRNNALGVGEDMAGGALVGFQYGGPVGAAIGAGVGGILGGLRMAGVITTTPEKVKNQVHSAYGLVISAQLAEKLAQEIKTNYADNVAMGIRSQDILAQLALYAKATGQNFPLANVARPLYLTESGGHLFQAASYDPGTGKTIGFQSGMQTIGGPFQQTIGNTQAPNNPGVIVPGFASGGLVSRPTLATVAEREPEAIIPISRMRQAFGSSAGAMLHALTGGSNFRLPSFGGPLSGIMGSPASGGSDSISLSLDGKSSAAFLQGQTVDAINGNPRVVQSASLAATASSWGRSEQAAMLTEPGTILA